MTATPKRPRPYEAPPTMDVRRLISDLHNAVTTRQRFRVLQDLLHHSSPDIAPLLMEGGILRALCLQLGFCLNRSETSSQVEMICGVILSVFHDCHVGCVTEASIRNVGTELFFVLIKVWEQDQHQDYNNMLTLLSIWKHFSASATGAAIMVKHIQLLPIIKSLLENHDDDSSKPVMEETLGIMKHISHHVPDVRFTVLETMGHSLARLSAAGCLTQRSMERQVTIFRNLAQTSHVRVAIASHAGILNALFCTLSHGNPKMIRHGMICLDSLTMEQDSCLHLVLHADGMILSILLHFLTSSQEENIRKRSARSLRLLANAVPILLNAGNNVMDVLLQSALRDISGLVQREAAMAYAKCASQVTAGDGNMYGTCLDGLALLLEQEQQVAVESVAGAIKTQAEHCSANRQAILNHERVLPGLSVICTLTPSRTTRDSVSETFLCLVNHEAIDEQFVTPLLLTALVCNAREGTPAAIQVLVRLATSKKHRKQLVTHQGLLQTLLHHAASSADVDKESVKQTILLLVPQL